MGDVVSGVTDIFFGDDEVEEAHQSGSASTMTPEQLELLRSLIGVAQGGVDDGAQFYQGQRVANTSPLQRTTFNTVNKLLGGANLQGAMNTALAKPKTNTFNQKAVNDFYKKGLLDPAMRTFMKETAPAIQEKYVSQNALESGSYNRALAGAAGDVTSKANADMANIMYNSREAQLNRDFNAGQAYNNRALSATNLLSQLGLDAGATQRGIEQQFLTSSKGQFDESQGYANPYLSLAMGLLDKSAFKPIVQEGYAEDDPGLFDFAGGLFNTVTGFGKAFP